MRHLIHAPRKLRILLLILLPPLAVLAETPEPPRIVVDYLTADTLEEALACLSPEYRLWFETREGAGLSKSEVAEMLQWDFALHPKRRFSPVRREDGAYVFEVHEENDFSRLIDFPGWDAVSSFWLDEAGLIKGQLYVPRAGQPEWRPYLEPALPWLREHRAGELERIFPQGRLHQSAEAARRWVKVLADWRAATGRPAIALGDAETP
jgi:hypothetical protein